ncbi:MAG: hypothetical protein Q8S35_01915 [bacterium]|nr:hypothetical protein [bacterium]
MSKFLVAIGLALAAVFVGASVLNLMPGSLQFYVLAGVLSFFTALIARKPDWFAWVIGIGAVAVGIMVAGWAGSAFSFAIGFGILAGMLAITFVGHRHSDPLADVHASKGPGH